MKYYINDLDGEEFRYIVQTKTLHDRNFREVEPETFKAILGCRGIFFETTEDKVEMLQNENATLILENIEKDLKIKNLEEENANLILNAVEQDLRVTQTEKDVAGVFLMLGGM